MFKKHFTVLGVPFNGIGVTPQEENPAQAIRDAGLIDSLKSRGAVVDDLGDMEIPPFDGVRDESTHVLNQTAWVETSLRLSKRLGDILDGNSTPLVFGGDCGILVGIIGAFVKRGRKIGLVSLDGHTDFRSPESSPSGEAADLPLWVLAGRGPAELSNLYGCSPMLRESEMAVFGYREPDMIEQSSIIRFDRDRLAKIGIAGAVDEGLKPLLDQGLDLWLQFDVDVIDPREMPAVHFPQPGGLSLEETSEFIRRLVDTERLSGINLTCYHNHADENGVGAARLVGLLADVLT